MPALHPSEDPGDCSKIGQSSVFTAPRRTRAEAGVLEFINGCGLLEILDDLAILGDVLLVKLEGVQG